MNVLKELLPGKNRYDCEIVIEPTLAGKSAELMARIGFEGKELLIVCDSNTQAALGNRIAKELNATLFVLQGKPYPDKATVDLISSKHADAIIAVGSGTISDICKYASFLAKKEYAIFPTAPSMNGYFSANASVVINGHKQSLAAHLPKGIFCDLKALAGAPKRLILSGLGDSLCRSTAQADWLLSHLLFNTAYTAQPFELLAPYEQELFSHADKLVLQDVKVIELLTKTLIASGLGMVIANGSYPASQGEHLIAHTMEMKYGDALPETYHGEQIGVTTLIMAEIQEKILSQKLLLKKVSDLESKIEKYFGKELKNSISDAYSSKYKLQEKYGVLSQTLNSNAIRDAINAIKLPVKNLRAVLQKAGAPMTAAELGWKQEDVQAATLHAKFIRDRFTFLDLM